MFGEGTPEELKGVGVVLVDLAGEDLLRQETLDQIQESRIPLQLLVFR